MFIRNLTFLFLISLTCISVSSEFLYEYDVDAELDYMYRGASIVTVENVSTVFLKESYGNPAKVKVFEFTHGSEPESYTPETVNGLPINHYIYQSNILINYENETVLHWSSDDNTWIESGLDYQFPESMHFLTLYGRQLLFIKDNGSFKELWSLLPNENPKFIGEVDGDLLSVSLLSQDNLAVITNKNLYAFGQGKPFDSINTDFLNDDFNYYFIGEDIVLANQHWQEYIYYFYDRSENLLTEILLPSKADTGANIVFVDGGLWFSFGHTDENENTKEIVYKLNSDGQLELDSVLDLNLVSDDNIVHASFVGAQGRDRYVRSRVLQKDLPSKFGGLLVYRDDGVTLLEEGKINYLSFAYGFTKELDYDFYVYVHEGGVQYRAINDPIGEVVSPLSDTDYPEYRTFSSRKSSESKDEGLGILGLYFWIGMIFLLGNVPRRNTV